MSSRDAVRLNQARAVYLGREGAPTAGDRWFSLYLIAFCAGFFIVPLAYVTGEFLDPALATALTDPAQIRRIHTVVVLMGIPALCFGRVQGPVYLTPLLAHVLLASDISRRRLLSRSTASTLLGVGLVIGSVCAVGLFALVHAEAWPWKQFAVLVAGTFLLGVQASLLAFLGQRLNGRWVLGLAAALLVTAAAGQLFPQLAWFTPAGWFAQLWTSQAIWPLAASALVTATGVVLVLAIPSALGKLPAERVLSQSRRFSDVRLFTATGNINDAVTLIRARPARRRPGAAVTAGSGLVTGLRRDVVTGMRTPVSQVSAAVLIPAGAALLTWSTSVVGETFEDSRLVVTVPVAVLGAALIFFGTGGVTEGWRQVKAEFDTAALYGWSPLTALARRVLWPLLVTAVLAAGGGSAVIVFATGQWKSLAWTTVLVLEILAARFMQSMRSRDIPVEFLAPTVIPGGMDLSAIKVLVWLGDGVILSLIGVLTAIILPWGTQALAVTLGGLILVGLILGWLRTGQPLLIRAPNRYR